MKLWNNINRILRQCTYDGSSCAVLAVPSYESEDNDDADNEDDDDNIARKRSETLTTSIISCK